MAVTVSCSGGTGRAVRISASVAGSRDELAEPAVAPVVGFLLVEKCQFIVLERLEELVPRDLFQRVFRLAEVDAQYARAVVHVGDSGRPTPALLDPAADGGVI